MHKGVIINISFCIQTVNIYIPRCGHSSYEYQFFLIPARLCRYIKYNILNNNIRNINRKTYF